MNEVLIAKGIKVYELTLTHETRPEAFLSHNRNVPAPRFDASSNVE